MKSIVIAITGASAMQIAERSIQVLLENDQSVDLILSKGSYEVAKSERGINIPVDNTYLTIIVNKPDKSIFGHYILDLEK